MSVTWSLVIKILKKSADSMTRVSKMSHESDDSMIQLMTHESPSHDLEASSQNSKRVNDSVIRVIKLPTSYERHDDSSPRVRDLWIALKYFSSGLQN